MQKMQVEKRDDKFTGILKLGFVAAAGFLAGYFLKNRVFKKSEVIEDGLVGLIGETKMVKLQSLSKATGCNILASFF